MTIENGVKKPIIIKFSKNHLKSAEEFKALMDISQVAEKNGTHFVQTYAHGKVIILDRELRSIKHFSKLSDDEMIKAFEDQVWSYFIQEYLGDSLDGYLT